MCGIINRDIRYTGAWRWALEAPVRFDRLGRTSPRDRTSALIQSPKCACHESHTRSDFSFIALFINILHAPSRADDNRVYFWITWYEIRSFVTLADRKCNFKDATLTDRGGISNMIVASEDVKYRQTPRKIVKLFIAVNYICVNDILYIVISVVLSKLWVYK